MYADPQGNIQQIRMIEHIGITYGLEFISLLMIVTFAFMISATFRSSSLAISLSILLLFVGNVIVGVLSRYESGQIHFICQS